MNTLSKLDDYLQTEVSFSRVFIRFFAIKMPVKCKM